MTGSLRRTAAIARTTFTELVRLRVFYVLLLFATVLILSATFLSRISFQQELLVTRDISLGAVNFFLCLLAVVATAQLLPRDLEDRVVYSILAKPVHRFEYLLGKFFGVLSLLFVSLVTMSLLCVVLLHFREQSALRETTAQVSSLPAEQAAPVLRSVHEAGVNATFWATLILTFLKAAILAAMTLLVSTFASSSIFTIAAMAMAYLIGHLEGIARDYWLNAHAAGGLTRVFIAVVVIIFPDLQAYSLPDQAVTSLIAFILPLAGLAGFYLAGYLVAAMIVFAQREL